MLFFLNQPLILSKLYLKLNSKKNQSKRTGLHFNGWMMGFEPTTPGTTNQCSNQLSYNHHFNGCKYKFIYSHHINIHGKN